ncbi:arylesterase [Methylonatrum kenyense]|uniref:arylesterase n=1 Tax=Methylonatrum kenyense TaxID=455253 RepID=UPI0020C168E8|nr:arylesterase [Methylonatrum kenyense]MCK8517011.1 arylesterase [Methylonatrum kenyense]
MPRSSARKTILSVMTPLVAVRRLLAALLLVTLMGPAAFAEQRQILVLGDSLSAAYNMSTENGWVHLLNERLSETAPHWKALNVSISGEITRGGLSRLPRAMDEHEPDLVIIALGGNDGLQGLPPAEIERNLQAMVETAREAGAEVLLAGVRMPPNYGAAYLERFEQVFASVADNTDVALLPGILDGFDHRPELFMDDRIHPTEEAQPLILDNVWRKLEAMLENRETF